MKLSNIADKIHNWEEITREELGALQKAVARTNEWHRWDTDDIVSKLAFYIKKTYNPDADEKEKSWWLFKTILWLCQDEGEEALYGTLYYKPLSPMWVWDNSEVINNYVAQGSIEDEVNFKIMEEHFIKILNETEKYIYINNIQWWLPYKNTAERFNMSPQLVEIIRDRTVKKIADYIENYLK